MSASAGRVLILPKGDYDNTVEYKMLDMVTYQNGSYLCKQTTTGNLPTDATYWQEMITTPDMTGASAGAAGVHGLVPAPSAGDQGKVLFGSGTWGSVALPNDMTGATALTPGVHGLVPAPAAGDENKFLRGDGTWAAGGGIMLRKYAFHYSETDSNPDSVTYPAGYDNSAFTDPFYVDLTTGTPHYGDWETSDASFLFPRSCMLKYDGTVDYYLDEDDETKKEDGTASDVADSSYAGNAMVEWGKDDQLIYWKIIPDNNGNGFTFVVANYEVDSDMKPWNHYNCNGTTAKHFYTPKYFGSSDGTRLRSISGGANYVSANTSTELNLAKANNLTSSEIWNTEVYSDWLFIGLLEVLLCKSMNTQLKFGYGRCSSSNSSAIGQGTMNGTGMFYGKSDQTSGVKIFGMENPYGNLWRRIAGLVNVSGTVKVKLTYGQQDGSSVDGYNLDGSGYISHGSTGGGTSGGYISHMNISNRGLTPATASGSDSTYYTDGLWFNNSQTDYALVGSHWAGGLSVGAFCCHMDGLASLAGAVIGAALSCKPLS